MSEPKVLELETELKKSRSYMTRYLTEDWSFNHTGSNQYLKEPIKFDATIDDSNDYLESGDNGAVVIKEGVNHVNVKASARMQHTINNHTSKHLYIRKNGETVADLAEDADYKNTWNALTIFKDYIPVKEGDKIQIFIACDNETGSCSGNANYPFTQMSVKVAD